MTRPRLWPTLSICALLAACSNSPKSPGLTFDGGPDGGADAGSDAGADAGQDAGSVGNDGGPLVPAAGISVLQHHKNPSRDGRYIDPQITSAAAATLHADATFNGQVNGAAYGQPLYLESADGGTDLLFVATEQAILFALRADNGAVAWQHTLGTPVAQANLQCGNIDPLGATGTPVIDPVSRTIYVASMTTPDSGATKKHLIYALSADQGTVLPGWPVDVSAAVTAGAQTFNSQYQMQRGALLLLGDTLYVPYGGLYGNCGDYHGWLVGVPVAHPGAPQAWATGAKGGGAWGPGGVATDGTALFLATGNTIATNSWAGGEAILRFSPGPAFSGATDDYFAPTDWLTLDNGDVDLGGSGPLLIDVPGAQPPLLAVALGKDGNAYLLDRNHLGGIGGQLSKKQLTSGELINAASTWQDAQGAEVIFSVYESKLITGCPSGQSGNLGAFRISAGAPPQAAVAWCQTQQGMGSPIVTSTDGGAEPIVWWVSAEGDSRLRAYAADTGAELFDGGGAAEKMGEVRRFQAPIVAKGRIFVAADNKVWAFTP